MTAIRMNKRGVMRRYGPAPGSVGRGDVELWNAREGDSEAIANEERTPKGMTFPHWAGGAAYAGQIAITAHGEAAKSSPYLRALKKQKGED